MVQRALEAWLGGRHCLRASRRSRGEGSTRPRERWVRGGTRGAYFWLPSTGLPACLRAPSAPLVDVVIFNWARPPEVVADAELRGPLALEPLTDGAAVELDMGVWS